MEERNLIALLKQGSREAFATLYRQYWQQVYNFCHLYLTNADDAEDVVQEVRKHFRPEFVNRIDEIVVFNALDQANVRAIAKIQLAKLAERVEAQSIKLEVTDAALNEIAKVGFDPLFGARPLKRAIQDRIENGIAKLLLEGKAAPEDTVTVDAAGGEFAFGVRKAEKAE